MVYALQAHTGKEFRAINLIRDSVPLILSR